MATMYQLGAFPFSSNTLIPKSFERDTAFSWVARPRLNRSAGQQFTGGGEDKVKFEGVMYPAGTKTSEEQLALLRTQSKQGLPMMLVDGQGWVYGRWVVKRITEKRENLVPNSGAFKVGFTIEMEYYGEDLELPAVGAL